MIDNLGVTIVDNRPPPPPTEFEVSLEAFKKDVATAINKNSMEAYVGVPDFILAEFMVASYVSLCNINKDVHDYMELSKT